MSNWKHKKVLPCPLPHELAGEYITRCFLKTKTIDLKDVRQGDVVVGDSGRAWGDSAYEALSKVYNGIISLCQVGGASFAWTASPRVTIIDTGPSIEPGHPEWGEYGP